MATMFICHMILDVLSEAEPSRQCGYFTQEYIDTLKGTMMQTCIYYLPNVPLNLVISKYLVHDYYLLLSNSIST